MAAVRCLEQVCGLLTCVLLGQIIYSGGADVDILPVSASKGKALDFLLQRVRVPCHCTIQLDSNCPALMLQTPQNSIIVRHPCP